MQKGKLPKILLLAVLARGKEEEVHHRELRNHESAKPETGRIIPRVVAAFQH